MFKLSEQKLQIKKVKILLDYDDDGKPINDYQLDFFVNGKKVNYMEWSTCNDLSWTKEKPEYLRSFKEDVQEVIDKINSNKTEILSSIDEKIYDAIMKVGK